MVDCTRNTSWPRTVSSKEGWNSPSEKTLTLTSPSDAPKDLAMLAASCSEALPAKIFTPTLLKIGCKGKELRTNFVIQ
jgi:hypothetical protein